MNRSLATRFNTRNEDEDTRVYCNCREIDCNKKPNPNNDAPPFDYFPTEDEKTEISQNIKTYGLVR